MGLGNADEGLGFCFGQTDTEVREAHPWIHHDGNGAAFEQSEGEREEIEARLDHQHRADATADPDGLQTVRNGSAGFVELLERQRFTGPKRHGKAVRLTPGHGGQVGGDVDAGFETHARASTRKSQMRAIDSSRASSRIKCPASGKTST